MNQTIIIGEKHPFYCTGSQKEKTERTFTIEYECFLIAKYKPDTIFLEGSNPITRQRAIKKILSKIDINPQIVSFTFKKDYLNVPNNRVDVVYEEDLIEQLEDVIKTNQKSIAFIGIYHLKRAREKLRRNENFDIHCLDIS